MVYETLGDWCKWLEKNFSPEIMIPTLPVIIRLDGNNFSNWTKGLKKPFDSELNTLMTETTKHLVKQTNAVIGYTQSDEITLILYSDNKKTLVYNDGKKQKILSKLTSACTLFFNEKRKELLPAHNKPAVFDCRIYQVPSLEDAVAQLLWRENDAIKNSISMLAQSVFSHNELKKVNTDQMREMLLSKNISWQALEIRFKRGVYVRRQQTEKFLSVEEILALPEKHHLRQNPSLQLLPIKRSVIEVLDLPRLQTIKNKAGVIFGGEDPIIGGSSY